MAQFNSDILRKKIQDLTDCQKNVFPGYFLLRISFYIDNKFQVLKLQGFRTN